MLTRVLVIVSVAVYLVSSQQDCAKGDSNGIKDSFADCTTQPVADATDGYCTKAFGREFKSKKEYEAPLKLSEASRQINKGLVKKKTYIHTCGKFLVTYQMQNKKPRSYKVNGDHMTIGKNCGTVAKDAKTNKPKLNNYHCFFDETPTNMKTKKCPDKRVDITPHQGVYYNAGSKTSPIQFEIKICQCKSYDKDGKCKEYLSSGGAAHRGYHNNYEYEEEHQHQRSQQMYLYDDNINGATTASNGLNTDLSVIMICGVFILFLLVCIISCVGIGGICVGFGAAHFWRISAVQQKNDIANYDKMENESV